MHGSGFQHNELHGCRITRMALPASDKCFQHAGPVGHVWYQFLDRFTRSRMRVGSPSFIAAKVVLDEGVFGPIHVLGFFAYMTLVEGGSWQVRPSCICCKASIALHVLRG